MGQLCSFLASAGRSTTVGSTVFVRHASAGVGRQVQETSAATFGQGVVGNGQCFSAECRRRFFTFAVYFIIIVPIVLFQLPFVVRFLVNFSTWALGFADAFGGS